MARVAVTPREDSAVDRVVRWAGGCWVVAGVFGLVGLAHPDSFAIGFAESSSQPLWAAVHGATVVTLILTLFGLAGLAVRHGTAWGGLGSWPVPADRPAGSRERLETYDERAPAATKGRLNR